MKYICNVFIPIIFLAIHPTLYAFAYPYEKMEIVKSITRYPHSIEIQKMIPLEPNNRIFSESYWKVYYQQDKIVGEELFIKGKLSYYYVYFYTKNKVIQKGFFWYGIYLDIMNVKLDNKSIKQGFIYKDIPDSYKVFDTNTGKLTYGYIYPNKEI